MTLLDFIKDDPFYFGFFGLLLVLIVLYGVMSLVLRTHCKVKSNKNNQYKPPNWVSFILEDKHGQSIVLFLLAIFCIVFPVVFLFFNYWKIGTLSNEIGDWGAVGDYFGGLLNPILAFASFMALLYTIQIQAKELKLTREEMAGSREAQEKTSKALNGQLSLQAQQSFEISFFNIFKLLPNIDPKDDQVKISESKQLLFVDDIYFIRGENVSEENFIKYLETGKKTRRHKFTHYCEKYISNHDVDIFFILLELIYSRLHTLSSKGKKWTRDENEHYGEMVRYKSLLMSKISDDFYIYLILSIYFGEIKGRKTRQLKIFKILDGFNFDEYLPRRKECIYFFVKESRFFGKKNKAQQYLATGKHLTKDNFASDPLDISPQ